MRGAEPSDASTDDDDFHPGVNFTRSFIVKSPAGRPRQDRHADGSLTPAPGSPFKAGGAGTGTGLASQGAVQVSPDGRFLLAVDAGSDQISVLRIRDDGTLKQITGGTVASGGSRPVSIAIHKDLVYVANAGDAASNYTG